MSKQTNTRTKWTKKKIWMTVLSCFLTVMSLVFIGGGLWLDYYFGGLNTTELTKDHESLGISADAKQDEKITNIALFGIDSRSSANRGRSDAIIILSVDERHGKIKMISVLRDSSIQIEGRGSDKIAHAYAYGQAPLAIKTLNQNFNLNIKEYVSVNFMSLSAVIDKLGGLELDITEEEKNEINRLILKPSSGYAALGLNQTLVQSSGKVKLNGVQAMTYARIRKIDSDAERASRQQVVLNKLFEKARSLKVTEYPGLIRTILPLLETSLSYSDIIGLSGILAQEGLAMEQMTVPDKSIEGINLTSGYDENGRWVWKFDRTVAAQAINKFIYEED